VKSKNRERHLSETRSDCLVPLTDILYAHHPHVVFDRKLLPRPHGVMPSTVMCMTVCLLAYL